MNAVNSEREKRRGGARQNAGRKPKGNVILTLRVSADFAKRIRKVARENNKTIGDFVEGHLRF